ncbi:MAG: agmatinase [Actinomycetota bacterium]|nr:agmatinase [Actinomycetota bacterium]
MRFLESRPFDAEPAQVVVQGVAYDGGTSFRRGSASAPSSVREASDSIESWSPRLRKDLIDIDVADAGDIDVDRLDPADVMERIARATEIRARTGARIVTFGGDHSISIGTSRGLRAVYPDLVHVVYDAHLDMRPEYDDSEFSHACGTRHMSIAGPTCVCGVRSGSREEFNDADKMLVAWSEDIALPVAMRQVVAKSPVFVSLDLDVLDPSIFSGTGNPEPGGPTYRELREQILELAPANVVGIDLVECAPPWDASGVSSVVAAHMARELILGVLSR